MGRGRGVHGMRKERGRGEGAVFYHISLYQDPFLFLSRQTALEGILNCKDGDGDRVSVIY